MDQRHTHTSQFGGSLTSSEKFFYHFVVVSSKTANHITLSRALIIRFCFVVFANQGIFSENQMK